MGDILLEISQVWKNRPLHILGSHRHPDTLSTLFKFVMCIPPLVEVFQQKHARHNNSLISLGLRTYMICVVFGLLSSVHFIQPIIFLWLLSDVITFAHSMIGNAVTGALKYKLGPVIFIIYSILEVFSALFASLCVTSPLKHILIIVFFFHIICLKLLLKYKLTQLYWFNKRTDKKRDCARA